MQTLDLHLHDAKLLCKALLPHTSKDNVSPSLTGIIIGGEFGHTAYATDRYTLGRFDLTNVTDKVPEDFMFIPRDAVSWLASLGGASLLNDMFMQNYRVIIRNNTETHLSQVSVVWVTEEGEQLHLLRMFRLPAMELKPPVSMVRLFGEFERGGDARIHVDPEHLGKFLAYAKHTRSTMRITLSASSKPSKLSPILIEIGDRFKGLLAPMSSITAGAFGNDIAPDVSEPVEAVTPDE